MAGQPATLWIGVYPTASSVRRISVSLPAAGDRCPIGHETRASVGLSTTSQRPNRRRQPRPPSAEDWSAAAGASGPSVPA